MKAEERKEIVLYRISKAKETLQEVNLHINNKLWNTAVNRLYYACYYAVIALLIKNKINAQTHGGVRKMFGLYFVKNGLISKQLGKFYSDIFDKRQTGDYEDFIDYTEEEVISLIEPARQLISEIDKLIEK